MNKDVTVEIEVQRNEERLREIDAAIYEVILNVFHMCKDSPRIELTGLDVNCKEHLGIVESLKIANSVLNRKIYVKPTSIMGIFKLRKIFKGLKIYFLWRPKNSIACNSLSYLVDPKDKKYLVDVFELYHKGE
jgi:hypothetical protein